MTRLAVAAVLIIVVGLAGAMLWQHRRYVEARRERVQDRQPLLHSPKAFHVVTFLELAPGAELYQSVGALLDALEASGDAKTVYAGEVALNALSSTQLSQAFGEEVPWDAVVVVQFPSREAWERSVASEAVRRSLAGFARTYSHGMQRSPWANLALPQALLARRIQQLVTGAPSHFPFEPAPQRERDPEAGARLARLSDERELGRHAAVVVNLILDGSAEQAAADRGYVDRMLGLMAEGGHGPMHLGSAVTLERDAEFDRVALVYYPGIDYFIAMSQSRFYQGIFGGKQLGDTQASITVPVLDRLRPEP